MGDRAASGPRVYSRYRAREQPVGSDRKSRDGKGRSSGETAHA